MYVQPVASRLERSVVVCLLDLGGDVSVGNYCSTWKEFIRASLIPPVYVVTFALRLAQQHHGN